MSNKNTGKPSDHEPEESFVFLIKSDEDLQYFDKLEQINLFLQLLSYKENELVFIRFINPVNGRSIKECHKFPLKAIPKKKGYNTYFVVNGQGNKDADIKYGRILWIEHDNMPKEEQINLWKKYGLPEPTAQNDTGGKSIHSFWVLFENVPPEDWKKLERDLIEFTKADKSIKNISRVLRLPNCDYYDKKTGEVTGKTTIINCSGKKYSYAELRAAIPESVKADSYKHIFDRRRSRTEKDRQKHTNSDRQKQTNSDHQKQQTNSNQEKYSNNDRQKQTNSDRQKHTNSGRQSRTSSDRPKFLSNDYQTDTQEILRALDFIDSSCNYHDWFQVGVALHNHFYSSIEGLNIWYNWSQNPRNNKRLRYEYLERHAAENIS